MKRKKNVVLNSIDGSRIGLGGGMGIREASHGGCSLVAGFYKVR